MWLALDTATDQVSVAVGRPGAASSALEENLAGARRHAGALLPMVQALLRRAGATLDDLEGIILSDGPGSFTGLRVGASVAKALVHARRLPLWTAPSLLVRAAYSFSSDEIRTELIPSVRHPEELAGSGPRPDVVVGEAPPEARAVLERWIGRPVIGPGPGVIETSQMIIVPSWPAEAR